MFDGFDNNNGIVDDEADREDETKKRQRVDREAEERKQNEGANQRDRNRAQRNESRAPALQKNENNENNKRERFEQCLQNLVHPFRNRKRLIERHDVFHVGRELLLCFRHELADSLSRLNGVATR